MPPAAEIIGLEPDYRAVFLDDPDGLRLELTNFRAERRARLEHWDTCDAPEPAAG